MNTIILNKEELTKWLTDAWNFGLISDNYDSSGNHWSEEVFKKDGKYYALSFLDCKPCEMTPRLKGQEWKYELREVERHTRVVEEEYWEYI